MALAPDLSKEVVLFVYRCSDCLWGFVFGPCFVVQYLVSFLVFAIILLGKGELVA